MATRSAAWIRELSIEPKYFVDREELRARTVERILDVVETGEAQERFLVTGDRGVGKSIFMRAIAEEVHGAAKGRVLVVAVNARGEGHRGLLAKLARALAEQMKSELPEKFRAETGADEWIAELSLLANNHRITSRQVNTEGSATTVGGDGGLGLLKTLTTKLSFNWTGRRETSSAFEESQDVTEQLLHAAVNETFAWLARTTYRPLVLFDDIDQTVENGDEAALKTMVTRLLDLGPCIGLVHLRSELMYEDVRRELSKRAVELEGLPADTLLEIVRKRHDHARPEVRETLAELSHWAAIRTLAEATSNPYVFLSWLTALVDLHGLPPDPAWTSDLGLLKIARAAAHAHIDPDFLSKVGRVVDRCAIAIGGVAAVTIEDLQAGRLSTDHRPVAERLDQLAIDELVARGYLLQRNRFEPRQGYRLDPALDLIRPSIAEKVRAAR